MNLQIAGHHIEVTPALRVYVENKLDPVVRHFDKVTGVNVVLSVEKFRHVAEISLSGDGANVIAKEDAAGRTRYHYNAAGRLAQVTDEAGREIASYGYDPFGRRVWKAVDGKKTWFHYAEEGLAGEYDAKGRALRT